VLTLKVMTETEHPYLEEYKFIQLIKENLSDFKVDFIDVCILALCYQNKRTITWLAKSLDIAYKNLLPHLRRMEKYQFIIVDRTGSGNAHYVSTTNNTDVLAFLELAGIPKLKKRLVASE